MKIAPTGILILAALAPACAFNVIKPVVQSSYLENLSGGGAATMKRPSYAPSKGKPKAPGGGVPGNYLESMKGAASAPAPAAPAPAPAAPAPAASSMASSGSSATAATTSTGYLSNLNSGASAPGGAGLRTYIDGLPARSEASGPGLQSYTSTLRTSGAPSGGGMASYLDAVGGGKGSKLKSSSYAPTKSSVSSGSSRPYSPAASSGESNAVLDAIARMNGNMNRNQEKTISVLKDINSGVKTLVSKADGSAGGAPPGTPWQ